LAWSLSEMPQIAVDLEVFRVVLGLLPRDHPQRKSGYDNEYFDKEAQERSTAKLHALQRC